MIPLASTGLGGSHDTVMEVELALNKFMLVGGPEETIERYHKNINKKYGSTSYLRIAQVLKWPPIHKV